MKEMNIIDPVLALLREFDRVFHRQRGRFCILPWHDDFLQELVDASVITNHQRYLIFASPRPTVFSQIRRGITCFRLLQNSYLVNYLRFVKFLRSVTSEGRSPSDFLAIREFLLYLETEFSNSVLITHHYLLEQQEDLI
jgi:hypothetical protein